jgi:hypothetical protein
MPEQKRYVINPEKHRAIARKSYHAHRLEIKKRRKERRDLLLAAQGVSPEPRTASRMAVLRATPRRVLQQSWTQDLFARMDAIIAEDVGSGHVRKTLRWAVRLILVHAEKDGLTQAHDITPAWVAGFPRQTKDRRKEPIYRGNCGRMLLRLGLWSEDEYQLLRDNLTASKRRGNPSPPAHGHKAAPSPPDELCQLVRELVCRCGLSTKEMRELRVVHIKAGGLWMPKSVEPNRVIPNLGRPIPFGDGWDELPKHVLDAYIKNEKPTDYLFFSRSPRDKRKPLSKMTLNGAVATLHTTIETLRSQHFEKDLNRARSLQEARFHLRNIHQLDNQYARNIVAGSRWHKGYANEAMTIPIPAPYVVTALCASRSVPPDRGKRDVPRGGERHLITWPDLLNYEITVNWPSSFVTELDRRGQRNIRALRLLFRLAFDFWFEGRRMKLPDVEDSAIRPEDKDLLEQLAATRAMVRDVANPRASWAGSLFEYGTRKRSFRIPLIEEMNRRAWHNQCHVCWHPERESIEREIFEVATKETRRKGYNLIASKYSVSYQSLKGHHGRRVPRPGRGETQRIHFSTGSVAPIVRYPRRFFEQLATLSATELLLYSAVLLEQNRVHVPWIDVSSEMIEQWVWLRVNEHELSLALNRLGPTGARLIKDFKRRQPEVFRVEL